MAKPKAQKDLANGDPERARARQLAEWLNEGIEREFGGNKTRAAEELGVDRATLYRLRRGEGPPPRQETLGKLSARLGAPPGFALSDRESEIAEIAELLNDAVELIQAAHRRMAGWTINPLEAQNAADVVGKRPDRQAPHEEARGSDHPKPKESGSDK